MLNSRHLLPAPFVDLYNTIRNLPAASLGALLSGAPGLLFDQEFGIFAYSPVLLLGMVGLAGMARDRSLRALSAGLILGIILLIGLASSLDPWWSESMMPGRTLLLVLRCWLRLCVALHPCSRTSCATSGLQLLCWRAWPDV